MIWHRFLGIRTSLLTTLIGGYALLAVCWVFTDPPGAAPDEAAHYVRALGIGQGQLVGLPAQFTTDDDLTPAQARGATAAARSVNIPRGLGIDLLPCYAGTSSRSADCLSFTMPYAASQERTYVGDYPPVPYLLPALASRAAPSADEALLLGRIASALACVALLASALWLVWDGRWLSVLGPVMALTPMVLFLASSLTPSGFEIVASVCFTSALLRLARAADGGVRWEVWAATGLAGGALALSRPFGPIWLAVEVCLFCILIGWKGVLHTFRLGAKPALLVCTAVVAMSIGAVAWDVVIGQGQPLHGGEILRLVPAGIRDLPQVRDEFIGVFGWLDTVMPGALYMAYDAALLLTITIALVIATARQRLTLVASGAATTVAGGFISGFVQVQLGQGMQARLLLPVAVTMPILAGEIIYSRRSRVDKRAIQAIGGAVGLIIVVGQSVALYSNGRRYAVGTSGPVWFITGARWAPPGGWWPWVVTATAGAILLFVGIVLRQPVSTSRTQCPASEIRRRSA